MNCNNCGHQLNSNDKFCSRCGTPVPEEKRCSKCHNILNADDLFCSQCGTRYATNPQPEYRQPQQNAYAGYANQNQYRQSQQNPYAGNVNQNSGYNPAYDSTQPKKYMMINKYIGEPTLGISKAMGTLYVHQDRLEYVKRLGSGAGNVFGPLGMAIAANKMKKEEGSVDVFYFRDIQSARLGKYGGMIPSLVLTLNDGQVFSFNGTLTNQNVESIVTTIRCNK